MEGTKTLPERYAQAIHQIQQLELENRQLLESNELFKQEVHEKQEILAKSSAAYSALKVQYEELLLRVTELHRENRANQSPELSPADSPQGDSDMIESLRHEIQAISGRKREYKKQAHDLGLRVRRAEQSVVDFKKRTAEEWEEFGRKFGEIVGPAVSGDLQLSDSESVLSVAQNLVYVAMNSVPRERYLRLKAMYGRLREKCNEFALQIRTSRKEIQEQIAVKLAHKVSPVEGELMKMQEFLNRYDAKCRRFGFS
jgi:hypothetical protein